MKTCTACRRHVRPAEQTCPFCGEAQRAGEAPRLGTVVLLGALGAACALGPKGDSASAEASSGETTGASTTSTSDTSTSAGATGTTSTGELTSSSDVDSGDAASSFYGGYHSDRDVPFIGCDLFAQDCAPDKKCSPYDGTGDGGWNSRKCVPVAPNPGKPGEPCTVEGSAVSGLDDCQLGAMCWNVDEGTLQGVCVAHCTGSPDQPMCAEPGLECLNGSVLTLCLPSCHPLMSECAQGETCMPNLSDDGFVCFVDDSGEEGQEFDTCKSLNECDPGLFCANSELAVECEPKSTGCCLAWCDLTMPACNGEGAVCLPWYPEGMAPEGSEDIGVCGLPQ